jgi:hypothetical protein
MILYVWKVINLPSISPDDLLYTLSFELFLFSPQEAKIFLQKALEQQLVIKNGNGDLKLNNVLTQQLDSWQLERKNHIVQEKEHRKSDSVQHILNKTKEEKFNNILKIFVDDSTLHRSASISDSDVIINELEPSAFIIKAQISGSEKYSYLVEIDGKTKTIKHNCNDFQLRRAPSKKFCKHLSKLFMMIKSKDKEQALIFLKEIAGDINHWKFIS